MTRSYLVTIKNNSTQFVSLSDLTAQFNRARGLYPKSDWSDRVGYEPDSLERMHFHGLVTFPNQISCKKLGAMFNHNSWHIHFRAVKKDTIEQVVSYITKYPSPHVAEELSYQRSIMRRAKLQRFV